MIILICGVGRAGKTTYSQSFENVLHSDGMGRKPQRFRNVINALTDGDVIIEGIYETSTLRVELLQAYKGKGSKCIWLDTSEQLVKERLKKDGIPMLSSHFYFEPPTLDEGWDEIVIIRGNDEQRISRQRED